MIRFSDNVLKFRNLFIYLIQELVKSNFSFYSLYWDFDQRKISHDENILNKPREF